MFFPRFAGPALLALALLGLPVRAAQTSPETASPAPTALNPTAPITPAPIAPAAPPVATPPSSSAPAGAVSLVPVNPLPHEPATTGVAPTPSEPHAALPLGTPLPEGSEPEKSVVQIITAYQEPNWAAPWIFEQPHFASGTGFLIDGNRIMTNAHVVAWTKQLLVRKYHDPQPYFATVEYRRA